MAGPPCRFDRIILDQFPGREHGDVCTYEGGKPFGRPQARRRRAADAARHPDGTLYPAPPASIGCGHDRPLHGRPLPRGASESFVARALAADRAEDVWAIDGSNNKLAELLGVVSLTRMEGDQSELGFWIGAGFWNTGFATEAVEALAAANPHGARTLFAEAFQDNPGSARGLTNCGFVYLGDAESWSVARGARVPTWTYLRRMG